MIKLVIFDCDGVVLDSESLYIEAALKVCKKGNYNIPLEIIKKVIGGTITLQKEIILDYMGKDFDFDNYHQELVKTITLESINNPPKIKKGFKELINYLKINNINTALATSTYKERQMYNLKANDIIDCFDYLLFGDDIKNSKPDPEIYLKVVEHFNYPKEEILIIEDSLNGILSGLNAGIKVIYIKDLIEISADIKEKTYSTLNDLSEVINLIGKINKE